MNVRLQDALESLYGLERRKEKLGLDGIRLLLERLDHPERRFRSILVAGTNGKGTTCALIERVLREAGLRTGLFTSPHLVDFRERIRVNGEWADEGRLGERLALIERVSNVQDHTFFEVCTALAFDDFAHRGVEWAVVEVGLGGRLDCTNVLEPEVSVITSIGLDHTQILGGTIEAIATEKAGIIKPGVPAVVGPVPERALAVIRRIADEREAPLITTYRGGWMTRRNQATARAVLQVLRDQGIAISQDAEMAGFTRARWPGRFERCPTEPRLWWDGAHNPEAAEVLARTAGDRRFDAMVLAVSRHKDLGAMLSFFAEIVPSRRAFVARTHNVRAVPVEEVAEAARARGWDVECVPEVPEACRRALAACAGEVLLAGSLFAVGECMQAFGGAPEARQ